MSTDKPLYDENPSYFRRKPISYSLMVLFFLGGIGGTYYFFTKGEPIADLPYLKFVSMGLALLGFLVLLLWWLSGKATNLILTDTKTTLHRGILSRSITEVYHTDVRNVQLSQTFFQRIFSVGTIGIASAGQGSMEIYVEGMPNPDEVKAIIDKHRHADKSGGKSND
jgi:uncharacterized membrane protein YdbT with pleckstrin-like domain